MFFSTFLELLEQETERFDALFGQLELVVIGKVLYLTSLVIEYLIYEHVQACDAALVVGAHLERIASS